MTMPLDPRLNAFRADLADSRLRGRVAAARFAEGVDRRIRTACAPMRREPRPDAPLDTEGLFGEEVRVFEETAEGWAWGQLATDGYVGWLPSACLAASDAAATHRVSALRSFAYPGPDMKLPPIMLLSINARVAVRGRVGNFADTDAGFVFAGHLSPLDHGAADPIEVAARFVGTPYLWGGRTSLGLDCSALVQLSLAAAGLACPRDSDMQAAQVGAPVDHSDPGALARGDLLFWRGHVAIVASGGMLLHANAHHMETVIEPLSVAVARIGDAGLPVTGARRVVGDAQ